MKRCVFTVLAAVLMVGTVPFANAELRLGSVILMETNRWVPMSVNSAVEGDSQIVAAINRFVMPLLAEAESILADDDSLCTIGNPERLAEMVRPGGRIDSALNALPARTMSSTEFQMVDFEFNGLILGTHVVTPWQLLPHMFSDARRTQNYCSWLAEGVTIADSNASAHLSVHFQTLRHMMLLIKTAYQGAPAVTGVAAIDFSLLSPAR